MLLQSILLSSGPLWTFVLSKVLLPNTLAPCSPLFVVSCLLLGGGVFLAVYPQVTASGNSSSPPFHNSSSSYLPTNGSTTLAPAAAGQQAKEEVVGYNGWWIGLYLLSTGLPNIGSVLQGWFLQRYSIRSETTKLSVVASSPHSVDDGAAEDAVESRSVITTRNAPSTPVPLLPL